VVDVEDVEDEDVVVVDAAAVDAAVVDAAADDVAEGETVSLQALIDNASALHTAREPNPEPKYLKRIVNPPCMTTGNGCRARSSSVNQLHDALTTNTTDSMMLLSATPLSSQALVGSQDRKLCVPASRRVCP